MWKLNARFQVGQPIMHKMFEYRGVIVDVDPTFQGNDDWYDRMAKSRPPKNAPWYHILVDGAEHWTYVAERNLEVDLSGEPIEHPDLPDHFFSFADGLYQPRHSVN